MCGLFHIQGSPGDGLITQSARGERLLLQPLARVRPFFTLRTENETERWRYKIFRILRIRER